MADRVVIVRIGTHLVSVPFGQIDEILGTDRINSIEDLPEGVVQEGSSSQASSRHWVYSRGTWLPVKALIPGTGVSSSSQIVVARWEGTGKAFVVDQVLGIETPGKTAPFPERARPFTDIPIAGIHFWKKGIVLELDLSRLISLDLGN
ncbi:MAG: chemotaxis protein CheW [bacterium]|nr:MAG: chemotaxis protein CheW [bacterium]